MTPKLVVKYVTKFLKVNSRKIGIIAKQVPIETLKLAKQVKDNLKKFFSNLHKSYQKLSWQQLKYDLKTPLITISYYVEHPRQIKTVIKKFNFKANLQKLREAPQQIRKANKLVQQQFLAFTSVFLALIILILALLYLPQNQKTIEENTIQKLADTDLEKMDANQKTSLEQEDETETTTTDKSTPTNTSIKDNLSADNPGRELANIFTNEGGNYSETEQASDQNSGANNNPNSTNKDNADKEIIRRGSIDDSARNSSSKVPESYQTYSNANYNLHYPPVLNKQTSNKHSLRLVHSVEYQHTDPCTQQNDAKFTDFDVYFRMYDQSLLKTIKEVEGDDSEIVKKYVQEAEVDTSSQTIETAKLDSYYGYKIKHKEECGYYNYYISVTPIHTMHIKRQVVTEYQQTDADRYQRLEDSISTNQTKDYLNKIMKYLELKQE